MKYLPQDFDLMPYITVEENIGKNISILNPNRNQRIHELLEVVDMVDFLKTKVKNLSGGQKQRIAIAKVLAKEPEVLLLDEPFSHIDNFRKNHLRRSLFIYLKLKNILCLVATHDTTDSLSFADEILVIRDGEMVAKNTPEKLYNNPNSAYVASFFNEINEIPRALIDSNYSSEEILLLYPNQIKIVEKSNLKVKILSSYFKGSYYLIEADFNGKIIYFEHISSLKEGNEVYIDITL